MKKKIGLLILSVSLISLLTACGEKKDVASSTPESEASNGKEMTFSEYFAKSKKKHKSGIVLGLMTTVLEKTLRSAVRTFLTKIK